MRYFIILGFIALYVTIGHGMLTIGIESIQSIKSANSIQISQLNQLEK